MTAEEVFWIIASSWEVRSHQSDTRCEWFLCGFFIQPIYHFWGRTHDKFVCHQGQHSNMRVPLKKESFLTGLDVSDMKQENHYRKGSVLKMEEILGESSPTTTWTQHRLRRKRSLLSYHTFILGCCSALVKVNFDRIWALHPPVQLYVVFLPDSITVSHTAVAHLSTDYGTYFC